MNNLATQRAESFIHSHVIVSYQPRLSNLQILTWPEVGSKTSVEQTSCECECQQCPAGHTLKGKLTWEPWRPVQPLTFFDFAKWWITDLSYKEKNKKKNNVTFKPSLEFCVGPLL